MRRRKCGGQVLPPVLPVWRGSRLAYRNARVSDCGRKCLLLSDLWEKHSVCWNCSVPAQRERFVSSVSLLHKTLAPSLVERHKQSSRFTGSYQAVALHLALSITNSRRFTLQRVPSHYIPSLLSRHRTKQMLAALKRRTTTAQPFTRRWLNSPAQRLVAHTFPQ